MMKILVIEDERAVRENILDILGFENFEGLAAENGQVGVEIAKAEQPDLIICDVMMPLLDGYGVLKTLQQDSVTAGIPLIFLTAKADQQDWRMGMQLGADDYLTKPFTATELLQAITTRLERKSAVVQSFTTKIKQLEESLNHLLYYDNLTHLPNRQSLPGWFTPLQSQAAKQQQLLAILMLSLDQLKQINSYLGYEMGDRLIREMAKRLSLHLNRSEAQSNESQVEELNRIAYLGNGQFGIALIKPNRAKIEGAVREILKVVSEPVVLDSHRFLTTASISITLHPEDGNTIDSLINHADIAMHHVKERGGNSYHFYTLNFKANLLDRLTLETDLRQALNQQELQVYYQPQIDLKSGQIIGAEALIRWQHSQQGMISPARFIPVAEETGLIIPIGKWILKTACQQMNDWISKYSLPLKIAVNLSACQLDQPYLDQMIMQNLADSQLDPRFLDLEITESFLIHDGAAIATFKKLKSLGLQISIDDFGVGYSSLKYLQNLPFDTLKIDRCFVRDITSNPSNMAIATAVIHMAHELSLKVVAEGVETQAELDFLNQKNCDFIQGYFFSPPLPAAEFEALLAAGKHL